MKITSVLVPLGLLGAAPVAAQPILPPVDSPQPTRTLPEDPEDPPGLGAGEAPQPEPPPPEPVVMAPAQTPAPTATQEPPSVRPTAFAIALGLGYVIPSDLAQPNVTSARLRLPSGLTFEPRVTLGHESQVEDDGSLSVESATNAVELGVMVRFPLRSHGRADLSLVGGGSLSLTTINPDGDDNNTQINALGVSWGVALDYWVTQHWNVSFTAMNPVLITSKTTREQGPGLEEASSRTTFGAIFDPTLAVMLHLYL